MKISKFKKFISWNLISLLGYCSLVIMIVFLVLYSLTTSQLHMRSDLDKYFYEYLSQHVINPYFSFYKTQISIVIFLLISSIFENRYYKQRGIFGFRIFENHEIRYSRFFIIGLSLNFLPMYMASMFILTKFISFFLR